MHITTDLSEKATAVYHKLPNNYVHNFNDTSEVLVCGYTFNASKLHVAYTFIDIKREANNLQIIFLKLLHKIIIYLLIGRCSVVLEARFPCVSECNPVGASCCIATNYVTTVHVKGSREVNRMVIWWAVCVNM